MTIKRKATAYLVLLTVISSVLVIFAFTNLNRLTSILKTSLPDEIHELNASIYIKYLADKTMYFDELLTQSARNYVFTSDTAWLERYHRTEKELDEVINQAIEAGSASDRGNFQRLNEANVALIKLEYQAISLTKEGLSDEARKLLDGDQYRELKAAYFTSMRGYLNSKGQEVSSTLQTVQSLVNEHAVGEQALIFDIKSIILVFSILLVLITLVLTQSYASVVVRSVGVLKDGAARLAKGDFQTRIDLGTRDEFEELALSFNTMGRDLDQLTKRVNQEAVRAELTNQRNAFSRDLHDRLGITISSLKLHLGQLKPIRSEDRLTKAYNTCRELIIEAYAQIRELSDNPLTETLMERGLKESLTKLFHRTEMIFPVRIRFITDLVDEVWQDEEKASVYSLIRELLNNAVRPGKADLVEGQLLSHNSHYMIMVEDDGVGFDVGAKSVHLGNGLNNSRDRVAELGGHLFVDSEPGKGTCISIELPVKENTLYEHN